MSPIGLLDAGLPQTFNLWKRQYMQSAIKWDMTVIQSEEIRSKEVFLEEGYMFVKNLFKGKDLR